MNAAKFDALTRSIAAALSRRQLGKLAVGGLGRVVLAGVISAPTVDAALLRSPAIAAQEPSCKINTVTVWLNAFIPGTLPDVSEQVPAGPFAKDGQTMIHGLPGVGDCFLTDQRDFSPVRTDSARMHSEITIDVIEGRIVGNEPGTHVIGETVEIDCEDGEEECRETASNDRMAFSSFEVRSGSGAEQVFLVELKGAGANPCFTLTPAELVCDIDYSGTFTITVASTGDEATVTFEGWVDEFPAYEAYAAADGGAGQLLFTRSPETGKTPAALCDSPASIAADDWHPTVAQSGNVVLRCDPGSSALYQFEGSLPAAAANGVRCGDRPCTSGSLSFRLGIEPPGRVTAAQVDIEVARDMQPAEECGVSGWEFHGQELYEFGWGPDVDPEGLLASLESDPSLYVAVVGSLTEYYAGPKCDPAEPFGQSDVWAMPFFLNLVDARTLALCADLAFTRVECLASPVALLTGPEPLILEDRLA